MAMNAGDVIRASARFRLGADQDHVNVYYYRAVTAISWDDTVILQQVRDHLAGAYGDLHDKLTNRADPIDVKIDQVEFVGGVETIVRNLGTIPFTMTLPPSGTGEALPPGVAALVKFLTGVGKVYGRKFVGMLLESAQSNGSILAATLANLEQYAAKILAGIESGGSLLWETGVMSKKLGAFKEFTSYDASTNVAYQRRRRPGTGS